MPLERTSVKPMFLRAVLAMAFILAWSAWAQTQQVKIEANWFLASDAVQPGDVAYAALRIKLDRHFHVQSNKPLDEFLVPTVLSLTPPAGLKVREIVYPKPVRFEIAGDPAEVFESEFVIGVALDAATDVKPGTYPISGTLQYQACDDKLCLQPSSLALKTELKVVSPASPTTTTNSDIFDRITFSQEPPPVDSTPATLPAAVASKPTEDCDVIAELRDFTVLGTTGGYLNAQEFIQFVKGAEAGTLKKNFFEDMGPIAIVLFVILGGIALNLTPCVLPLIPINLAIIGAGAQAGSRARGFALGGTYGLAMALVYGALGLIVTLTSAAFGEINGTIWFNVSIAILFVFLALAMFDVIAIDFTKYQSKVDTSGLAKKGAFALAFGMGAVSALLAGACVAPVVIQVVVYASDQYA